MFGFLKDNMRVLVVTRTWGMFSRMMVMPYAPIYVLALGGTTASVGIVDSLRPLASLLVFPVAGFFADRGSRVRLIIVAGFLSALANLFEILAFNWTLVAVGSFVTGMIVFHFPAESALTADSLHPSQRGVGFATLNSIPGAVAVVAPFLGGYLIDVIGVDPAMRYLYILLLLAYMASAIIYWRFLKETLEVKENGLGVEDMKAVVLESYRNVATVLRWMPRSLRTLAVVIALNFMANAIAAPFWIVYGTEVICLTASEWGLLTLISSAFTIAILIPAGAAVDRFGRRKAIIVSFIITIPSVLAFTYARGFLDVMVLLLVISVANAFMNPACEALTADLVPREMRGRVMAAVGRGMLMTNLGRGGGGGPGMGYIFSIPVMLGSLIGGFIYGVNPALPWILQSAVLLGILVGCFAFLHEPQKAEV